MEKEILNFTQNLYDDPAWKNIRCYNNALHFCIPISKYLANKIKKLLESNYPNYIFKVKSLEKQTSKKWHYISFEEAI